MTSSIEKMFSRLANMLGFECRKKQTWNYINVCRKVRTLVDVGVAHGTPELYRAFEFDRLLLVEPINQYKDDISKILNEHNAIYEPVALSCEQGESVINVNKNRLVRSSIHERTPLTKTNDSHVKQRIKIETLDNLIQKHNLAQPFGIKIDTEGHELNVLLGAVGTLKNTAFVIVETSVQKRFEDSYSFEDLVCFMKGQGFSVANILSSDHDGQGLVRYADLLFMREEV
ncbi:MAG: FkbM family methyltransferase [Pseudomonadota bacterium]